MRLIASVVAVTCAACANNPGVPAYPKTQPRPLPAVAPARVAETVRLDMKALPWWTLAGTNEQFVLKLEDLEGRAPEAPAMIGRTLGPLRTRDIQLDVGVFNAVRCAWQIVPMGESRPCRDTTREQAMEIARDAIGEARAELRAKAADVGAGIVADARCFAEWGPYEHVNAGAVPHLWCEGVAQAGDIAPSPEDPAAPIAHTPGFTPTRFLLVADGSVGMLGDRAVVASTLGFRYRPFEIGFYILDLQREGVLPQQGGKIGMGLTLLGRRALGRSRADAIAGVSAVAAFQNDAINPDIDGLYNGFVGLAYQSPWRIAGSAQPFAQLRAGVAYGTAIAAATQPMVELHLGLSTPERR